MRSIVIGLIVALALPAGASAAGRALLPPGNSGAGEYVESVPTAGGQRPTNGIRPHRPHGSRSPSGSPGASGPLTPSVQAKLDGQGRVGAEAATLATALAPTHRRASRPGATGAVGSGSGSGTPGGTPAGGAALTSGSSPAALVLKALTGSASQGGLGVGLLLVLILSGLGAGVLALRRRRAG